jgi:hypothetical protein
VGRDSDPARSLKEHRFDRAHLGKALALCRRGYDIFQRKLGDRSRTLVIPDVATEPIELGHGRSSIRATMPDHFRHPQEIHSPVTIRRGEGRNVALSNSIGPFDPLG